MERIVSIRASLLEILKVFKILRKIKVKQTVSSVSERDYKMKY